MDDAKRETAESKALAFERERLKLEAERLALERERLDARDQELEARAQEMAPRYAREIPLGPGAIAVVVCACLALGAAAGVAVGYDWGVRKAPKPHRVELSRGFRWVLQPPVRGGRAPERAEEDASLFSGRRTEFPEALVIVR